MTKVATTCVMLETWELIWLPRMLQHSSRGGGFPWKQLLKWMLSALYPSFCITSFLILRLENVLILASSSTVVCLCCHLLPRPSFRDEEQFDSFFLLHFLSFQFPSTSSYPRVNTSSSFKFHLFLESTHIPLS